MDSGKDPNHNKSLDYERKSEPSGDSLSLKEFVRSFIAELLVIAIGAPIVFWVMVSTDGCR